MPFLETPRFPEDISYNSSGGPMYQTDISRVESGHETRIAAWLYPLFRYNISYAIRTPLALYGVVEYFHACAARTYGFRFKDHSDYKSNGNMLTAITDTDQQIGVGDAVEKDFQLIKTYTKGALSQTRIVYKPVVGTTIIALDGVPQGSGWTIDTTTGIVTFTTAPGAGVVVTAGFEYDVPVRFSEDDIESQWDAFEMQSSEFNVEEIRIEV